MYQPIEKETQKEPLLKEWALLLLLSSMIIIEGSHNGILCFLGVMQNLEFCLLFFLLLCLFWGLVTIQT